MLMHTKLSPTEVQRLLSGCDIMAVVNARSENVPRTCVFCPLVVSPFNLATWIGLMLGFARHGVRWILLLLRESALGVDGRGRFNYTNLFTRPSSRVVKCSRFWTGRRCHRGFCLHLRKCWTPEEQFSWESNVNYQLGDGSSKKCSVLDICSCVS